MSIEVTLVLQSNSELELNELVLFNTRGVFYCQSKSYKGILNLLPATHWGQRRGHGPDGTEELKDFSKVSMTELSLDGGVDVCLPLSNYYFDHSQYQTSS